MVGADETTELWRPPRVALLVERSLLIPEFRGSNLVVGKLLNGTLVKKRH